MESVTSGITRRAFALADLTALLDVLPVGATLLDPRGEIVHANDRFARFLHASATALCGKRPAQLTHPDDREATVAQIKRLQTGQISDFVLAKRYLREDGAAVWGLTSAAALTVDGTPGYLLASIDDISSRVRAENLLRVLARSVTSTDPATFFRNLTEELASALQVSHAFVTETLEPDRTRVRTLAFWSDGKHIEQIEYALSETPCERVANLGHDAFFASGVREAFPNDPDLVDLGAESYLGVPLFGRADVPVGHLAILHRGRMCRDQIPIDALRVFAARAAAELERAKAERAADQYSRQVQHRQKLESLGMFAGGIAHDFNNVLMGIMGNADLARTAAQDNLRAVAIVDRLIAATEDAADLARQLLDYAGRGSDPMELLDLSSLIGDAHHLLDSARGRNAELRFDLARHLPPVRASGSQIKQILVNLITNASEALSSERFGDITVRTDTVTLPGPAGVASATPLQAGSYVRLSVADNGRGMSDEVLAHVFEPFYTTKRDGRGLGMGMVMGIATRHGGSVAVRSARGGGTVVEVFLPAESDLAASRGITMEDEGAGWILVVDDDPRVAEVSADYLRDANYGVVVARDGADGLALYRQYLESGRRFDAVLLDLAMPRMDGAETFRALRALDKSTAVVLCTGYDAHNDVAALRAEGLSVVLQKPFRQQQLLGALDEAMRARSDS